MASYIEINDLMRNETLLGRVATAIAVEAVAISNESPTVTNHANRLLWAKKALINPKGMAQFILPALLGQNASATVAQISGISDAQVQSAVSATVNLFADGSEP